MVAEDEDLELLTHLIQRGAEVMKPSRDSWTALHGAVMVGSVPTVKLLLLAGANPDSRGPKGYTALHLCSTKGAAVFTRVLEVLLASGANPSLENEYGETPLHLASYQRRVDTVRALIGAGADITKNNMRGETSLYVAAKRGNVSCVRILLESGADKTYDFLLCFASPGALFNIIFFFFFWIQIVLVQ